MLTAFLLLFAGGSVGCFTGWLVGRGFRFQADGYKSPNLAADQISNPIPGKEFEFVLSSDSNLDQSAPREDFHQPHAGSPTNAPPLYMIATECILYTGTQDECADFLAERGIIPHVDAMEPYDSRLQDTMDELGIWVFCQPVCQDSEYR